MIAVLAVALLLAGCGSSSSSSSILDATPAGDVVHRDRG